MVKSVKNKHFWLEGSFTLETALVFSIIFLLAEGMMVTMFLCHDRVVIKENAYMAIQYYEDGFYTEPEAAVLFQKDCNKRMFLTKIEESTLVESANKISIRYETKSDYIFSNFITKIIQKNLSNSGVITCGKRLSANDLVRGLHGVFK